MTRAQSVGSIEFDVSAAIAEPFVEFIDFHNSFNRSVKVTAAGLQRLLEDASSEDGDQRVAKYVRKAGQPWGTIRFRNPVPLIEQATIEMSNLWIVSVFSAFDFYLTRVRAELSRWFSVSPLEERDTSTTSAGYGADDDVKQEEDSDEEVTAQKLYQERGWPHPLYDRYKPLLDFFWMCRNCIAHRNGVASGALIAAATDAKMLTALKNSFRSARKSTGGRESRTLTLPIVYEGRVIKSEPRHAILASAICYIVAEELNARLVEELGIPGLAYMAAYHALLSPQHPARHPVHHKPEDPVNRFLAGRYRVKKVDRKRTIAVLQGLEKDVWKRIQKTFEAVYGREP